MYNIGTVSTTANSPKITGTGTRWKDNTTLVSVGQVVLIENDSNLLINSIYSIESNTALTLAFPVSAKLTNAKYIILTTMIDSISDGVNKATAQVIASEIFTDIFTELMTGTGTLDFELPNGQKVKLRTENEKDKLLDGKVDKTTGEMESITVYKKGMNYPTLRLKKDDGSTLYLEAKPDEQSVMAQLYERGPDGKIKYSTSFPKSMGTAMQVGNFGLGGAENGGFLPSVSDFSKNKVGFYSLTHTIEGMAELGITDFYGSSIIAKYSAGSNSQVLLLPNYSNSWLQMIRKSSTGSKPERCIFYSDKNTTKDANGNLKAASPVVKLFADDIELNEESEGVEMEHLGIGHYLIKGVVGFNADGAWGINNGFVIPQDHNGKNMVLIDYEVRPDGDIEVFVFHQQNADMPERFQNKRIKHFDEEGVPVYFENYEPCDVPESRWIDMRVEMPPNSLYNQKQAEAERLAKLEAERLAQEEAKRAAEEAERAEQGAAEQVEQQ
ncbi:phage tail fiber protein [Providencia sp. PROV040]|uniref:phage tail fiber protein n=1 Tax=Providencia sp. PROV040 TaxID=2949771 RepID=UPI00234A4B07|nr:hypothetical protein [Providencia sp. PROV040]WOB84569.1 hypothetical protein P3L40_12925 [Providencia sp. PROV040]